MLEIYHMSTIRYIWQGQYMVIWLTRKNVQKEQDMTMFFHWSEMSKEARFPCKKRISFLQHFYNVVLVLVDSAWQKKIYIYAWGSSFTHYSLSCQTIFPCSRYKKLCHYIRHNVHHLLLQSNLALVEKMTFNFWLGIDIMLPLIQPNILKF